MAAPDMDVIKEIPGYKVILKAVLKSQIQQLVEQLASSTDEESVILTASVADGTLCHLGSDSGKVFLEDHEDIKSQFLGFCLKRHHTKKQEKERQEAQEREEALARSMQAVTPPRYGNMGPRQGYMPQRSPRYPSPHQQQGIIPVALTRGPSGPLRSPGNRHQPYPMVRPQKQTLNFDQQGRGAMHGAMRLPVGNRIDGQVIKIEPDEDDDDTSNQSASDTANAQTRSQSESRVNDSSQPSTPSHSQGPAASDNDDAKSDTSSSTIPNEASDLGISDTGPPGGLSLDSDLSNLISDTSGLDTSVQSEAPGSESHTPGELDPNVSVKLEAMADSEMDLEITGVELGQRPRQETMASQEWLASVQNVMQGGASGSSADLNDQQAYNLASVNAGGRPSCQECQKTFINNWSLNRHQRIVHCGDKPYQCNVCWKAFSTKANLKAHCVVHYLKDSHLN